MATLIFVDTNIWLDFYRVRGKAADLSLLKKIDEHRDSLISTSQVEMEFKKNRPAVILDSYHRLKLGATHKGVYKPYTPEYLRRPTWA